jgi:hypothetical protein
MKRKPKKLTLSRETLSLMDESRLLNVAGGVTLACTATACSNCCSGAGCTNLDCGISRSAC